MRKISKSAGLLTMALTTVSVFANPAGAEGMKPIEYIFSDGTVVRVSGQINMGVLHYDDGDDGFTNFVDNDNSSSRARIQLLNTTGDWKYEATLEAEYQPLASNNVSQLNDTPNWDFPATNIRKAEVVFWHDSYGKLWLGQGSMASDGSAEVDNSGTSVIAYSSVPDTAGGYFFRFNDGILSDINISDAFSNFDGMGRKLRVRYDTPIYHGFGLRASYGEDTFGEKEDPLYDIAGTYASDTDQFKFNAALAYSRNDGTDVEFLSGSASVLHKDSGVSLTMAAAREFTDGLEGYYGYTKVGYQHDFFEVGSTAFSVDFYYGKDIAAADSSNNSVGLAAVQNFDDMNLQLWALWRTHHYDDDAGDYEDGQAVFGGAIFKF